MTGLPAARSRALDAGLERLSAAAYRVPTEAEESDGTLVWNSTTLVVVELEADGIRGLGFVYGAAATVSVIEDLLVPVLRQGASAEPAAAWRAMNAAVRNAGRPGIAASAISAVDIALWDLKAKRLGLPLVRLLGQARPDVMAYGSGGFTSSGPEALRREAAAWLGDGLRAVKIKVGRDAAADRQRVAAVREAIGPDAALFVDANGAYARKEALHLAEVFAEAGAVWFEEPVSSDDLEGLRLLRDRAPAPMEIAAGEYGYDADYFARMLAAGAVDVLQADATRCGGITGFLQADALAVAHGLPLSAHTAPSLHTHAGGAAQALRHVEYFHDHARIEEKLFDGARRPVRGQLVPDLSRPGLGLELRATDAAPFRVATLTLDL